MAIQKHNTYYDDKKPGSGIYYYDENGNHKEVLTKNDLNAISSISSINDKVTALSSKTVSEIKSTDTVTATPHTATDGTIYYELAAAPEISDTEIYGENGISAKNQGTKWTIGLSANYLSANALNNLSGNWQNTYSAVSSNSSTWNKVTDKVDTTAFTPVKNDVDTLKANSAHSTLSSKNDYIKVTKDGVNYGVEFISGDLATKTWVDTNYQEKGNYLSANALDNLSGKWQSTYNTVKTYSGDWQEVNKKLYTSAFEAISGEWAFSADVDKRLEDTSAWANATFQPIGDYLSANELDKIKETSGKWDSTYSSVYDNSAKWDEVTAKLDKDDFDDWAEELDERIDNIENDVDILKSNSAKWDEVTAKLDISSFSSVSSDFALKTEVQKEFEQTSAWVKDNFLTANALNDLSGNWESTYNTIETNSGKWETAYETLTTKSAYWDDVSAKLNSATFTAYSADIKSTIETFSGEFVELSGDFTAHSADPNIHISAGEREKWTSAANRVENSAAIWDTVSAKVNKTEFEEFKTSAHNELEKKLDKNAFESWSANKDYDFYSAGNGIKIENHIVSVSAKYALSADVDTRLNDYYDKDEVDQKFANFGGFVVVNELPVSGDNKKIYLINDPASPNPDQYKEYIYTENVWKCIGDTSVDLTQYYKKTETSAAEQISTEFTNTSAWANETFQPIGDYVTSGDYITPGLAWTLVNKNDSVQWSGLDVSELGKTYIVKSTNGSIDVGVTHDGNETTYDLSATTPDIEGEYLKVEYEDDTYKITGATIAGENGVSAEYNPETNEWNVGLDKTNLIAFGKFHSNINTYTTSASLTGFVQEDIVGDDIYLDDGKVYVNSGLYHIDIQVEVTVPGTNNEYYNTILKSTISPTRQIQQEIDGSYAHTETIDLSFDNRYAEDATELEFTIENLPANASIYVKNLNIHRIICSLAEIDGGLQYQAGDAIKIENDTINLDYGDGLELSGNKIQVKLGDGLKFDENAGVKAITINNEVEEVVETVTAIATDLDTKISNNFPPAMITVADADIAQYRNNGALYGTLFNVSINQEVEIDRSLIGMYIYRVDNNMNVVFGLYEYQPDYPRYIEDNPESGISAYGRTVPLCDTGVVQLTTATKGFCEWPIKNLNKTIGTDYPETRPSLKSSCMYYATIYMGNDLQAGGLHIGSFSGYAPQFNDIKPGLTIANYNINCSLGADYSSAVSFNDFGFSWKYNNYANYYAGTDNTYSTGNYSERNDGYRFYMQIRNKAKEA